MESLDQIWRIAIKFKVVKVLFLVVVAVNLLSAWHWMHHRFEKQDFAHYYASSRVYLDQHGLGKEETKTLETAGDVESSAHFYESDLRPFYSQMGWENILFDINQPTNPPPLIQLFSVYAKLSPRAAHGAWMGTQIVALVIVILTIYCLVKQHLSFEGFLLVLSLFLLLRFVNVHLMFSQVQLLVLALVMVANLARSRGYGLTGVFLVVVAALVKVFPVVLLPWFVWRSSENWKPRLACGVFGGTCLVAGVWLTDVGMWRGFFQHARPEITSWAIGDLITSFTLGSFFQHLGVLFFGPVEGSVYFLTGLVTGVSLLGAFYIGCVFRRKNLTSFQKQVEIATLMLMMLFCGTTCWFHYFVFLIYPATLVAVLLKPRLSIIGLAGCVIGYCMLMQRLGAPDFGTIASTLWMYTPMFSTIAMCIFLLTQQNRMPEPEHAQE